MNYYVDVVSVWRANKVVTLPKLVGWGQTSLVCSLSFLTSFFLNDGVIASVHTKPTNLYNPVIGSAVAD